MAKAPQSKLRRFRNSVRVLLLLLLWIPTSVALDRSLLPDYFPSGLQKDASYLARGICLSALVVQAAILGLLVFLLARRRTTQDELRWYQFSLRSLLMLMLLACIAMIPVAIREQQAKKQREAVDAVRKLGGSVTYDGLLATGEAPGPVWLHRLLGEDFFITVGGVRLDYTKVTDADLKKLDKLPQLHWLALNHTNVTDAGLENIGELAKLQTLVLSQTKITDAGLAHLGGLTQLETLFLGDTRVTDDGLERLKGFPQLSFLSVVNTTTTREGITKLQQALPRCRIVAYPLPTPNDLPRSQTGLTP
jgi:hypothetical protein